MADTFRVLCTEILEVLDAYEDGQRVDWDWWRLRARVALAEALQLPERPEEFEFAMDFLGPPEDEQVRSYVEALEAALGLSHARIGAVDPEEQ